MRRSSSPPGATFTRASGTTSSAAPSPRPPCAATASPSPAGASGPATSTTFLGEKMRIPVMLAPIGSLQVITPEAGAAAAQAAGEFGTIQVVSSVTLPSLEETAAAGAGAKIFQLYVQGDMSWVTEMLDRVRAAGYVALALTVDTAIYSRRERPRLNHWAPPAPPPSPRHSTAGGSGRCSPPGRRRRGAGPCNVTT